MYTLPIDINQLLVGCIFRTIVDSISTAHDPLLSYEVSWEDNNYNLQNTQGTNGTITFSTKGCIGAFFDANSSRSPFRSGFNVDNGQFLIGIPEELHQIAIDVTLQYMLQPWIQIGEETSRAITEKKSMPVITAAFWQLGHRIESHDAWETLLGHGGHIIEYEATLTLQEAVAHWKQEYELSDHHLTLAHDITTRRILGSSAELTKKEYNELRQEASNGEALRICMEKLAQVNVFAPSNGKT